MPAYECLQGLYHVGETIGSGGFGKVKAGVHILTGEKVAIKIMDKKKLGSELPRVQIEIQAMKELIHQNICQLYQVIETREKFFLILEYCSNGELFEYIVARNRLDEEEARSIYAQIISAVAYIHDCGYAHRDLKPENLLLDEQNNLKVIDFGLCSRPVGGMESHLNTCCGSLAYAAPELVASRPYLGREADIWSLGVLLYALLCGCLPFDDANTAVMHKKIQSGKYVMPSWLSPASRDLIKKMLQVDPNVRIKMADLLQHPWLTKNSSIPLYWQPRIRIHFVDEDCIRILRHHYRKSAQEMRRAILRQAQDYLAATYKLLLLKKMQGKPLVLLPLPRNYIVSNLKSAQEMRRAILRQAQETIQVGEKKLLNGSEKNSSPNTTSISSGETIKSEIVKAAFEVVPVTPENDSPALERMSRQVKNEEFFVNIPRTNLAQITPPACELLKNVDVTVKQMDPKRALECDQNLKQTSKNTAGRKVKWIRDKIPQTNCMRGCRIDETDEDDRMFSKQLKCCQAFNRNEEDDSDEFVFTDFRKRRVNIDFSEEKERKVIKTVVLDPSTSADGNDVSPRLADVLKRPRERATVVEDASAVRAAVNQHQRSSDASPGRKLTRWKNNQRRNAPDMRQRSDDQNAPERPILSKQSNRETVYDSSEMKPCERILDWLNKSSSMYPADDDFTTVLRNRENNKNRPKDCDDVFVENKCDVKKMLSDPRSKNLADVNSCGYRSSEMPASTQTKLEHKSQDDLIRSKNLADVNSCGYRSSEMPASTQRKLEHKYQDDLIMQRNTVDYGLHSPRLYLCKSIDSHLNHDVINDHRDVRHTASIDTELNQLHSGAEVQKDAKKSSIIGSFEKGVDRLIGIFTPKKKQSQSSEPRKVKTAHNVFATTNQDASQVSQRLKDVLSEKKILFKEKGLYLKCSELNRCNQVILSFKLEVVLLTKTQIIGIYHKRLAGDTWQYKRMCENIFKSFKP